MSRAGKPGPPSALVRKLDDPKVDEVARNHARRIDELNAHPVMATKYIADVALADGVETPVAHGLGRSPTYVSESCVEGAVTSGHIERVRSPAAAVDASKYVVLKASGYGATITVTVQVA